MLNSVITFNRKTVKLYLSIMLSEFLQLQIKSIVFLGKFNPAIVQPFWLASKKLIRDQEAQDADVEVIHNEITKYDINWASFEITSNRFEIKSSQDPYFEPLKDLSVSIFRILKDTPIDAVGINHLKYFALPDEKRYYEFGNALAPLKNWSPLLNSPRLLNLDIIENERIDKLKGQYRVSIRPTDIKLSTPYGVLVSINDHFSKNTQSLGANEIVDIVNDNWVQSDKRAEEVINVLDKI